MARTVHSARAMNVFPPYANAIFWIAIAACGFTLLAVPTAFIVSARSPYATGAQETPTQPVKFDHRHHVGDDGIDCEYCHRDVTRSARAGIPATSVCMGCHAQILTSSTELAPVRSSAFEGTPIHWERVGGLPDFVFFNHSAHVTKGVGCVSCHGRIDRMAAVYQAEPMTMRWCLDCHRNPEAHLRPLDRITDLGWQPDRPQEELGKELAARYGVTSKTHCSTCHR